MALDGGSPDFLIERLSWPADDLQKGSMISIQQCIRSTRLQRIPESSSIGLLDALPTELLHSVFNMLDFQSLSRLSRVSHRGKAAVDSLPAHRDLMEHAPKTLIALSRTKILTFHSASTLHEVLRSKSCECCGDFGPFLFLPTCKRTCYECLHRCRSSRVISLQIARTCFGLSAKHFKQMPVMFSLPGTYSVGHEVTHRRRRKVVSLKQAKELGIAVHGSDESMKTFVALQNAGKLSFSSAVAAQWLAGSDRKPEVHSLSTLISSANVPNDELCGLASISFSSLCSNSVTTEPVWCLGCHTLFQKWNKSRELDATTKLLISGSNPFLALLRMERRARSKSEFLKHIKECSGARNLRDLLTKQTPFFILS